MNTRVVVQFAAQIRHATGLEQDEYELAAESSVAELVASIAARHGTAVQQVLVDEQGKLHPSVLVFVGNQQVTVDSPLVAEENLTVTFLSPISGG